MIKASRAETVSEWLTQPYLAKCAATEKLSQAILAPDQSGSATMYQTASSWHAALVQRTGRRPTQMFEFHNISTFFANMAASEQPNSNITTKCKKEKLIQWTMKTRPNAKYTLSGKRSNPYIYCHNSGKRCQTLAAFWINNEMSNCKQITKFK